MGRPQKNGVIEVKIKDWPADSATVAVQHGCASGVFAALALPENSRGLGTGEIKRIRNGVQADINMELYKKNKGSGRGPYNKGANV